MAICWYLCKNYGRYSFVPMLRGRIQLIVITVYSKIPPTYPWKIPWTQQFMKEFLWGGLGYLPRGPVGKIIDILGTPTNHLVGGWVSTHLKNMRGSKLDHETPRFGMKISPTFELPPPSNAKFFESSIETPTVATNFPDIYSGTPKTNLRGDRTPTCDDRMGLVYSWNPAMGPRLF